MKMFLTLSTIFGMFLEGLYFMVQPIAGFAFDLKPGLIVILINLCILTVINQLRFSFVYLLIFAYLLLTGFFLMSGYASLYVKQFVVIFLMSIYTFSFVRFVGAKYIFNIYVKFSYFYAIFALLYYAAELLFELPTQYFMPDIISGIANGGLHGLMSEQSVYSIIMMPALYVSLKERSEYGVMAPILIGISVVITGSAMGYVGIILVALLYNKVPYKITVLLILVFVFFFYLFVLSPKQVNPESEFYEPITYYCASDCGPSSSRNPGGHLANPTKRHEWSEKDLGSNSELDQFLFHRIFSSYNSIRNERVPDLHVNTVSSYTLSSNFLVMKQVLRENIIFGGGLGSHPISYDKYIETIDGTKPWINANVFLGREDANSLATRLLSDFGLAGLLLLSIFFFRVFNGINDSNRNIVYSIFIYLILVFIRSGNYGPLDLWLFITILYFVTLKKDR